MTAHTLKSYHKLSNQIHKREIIVGMSFEWVITIAPISGGKAMSDALVFVSVLHAAEIVACIILPHNDEKSSKSHNASEWKEQHGCVQDARNIREEGGNHVFAPFLMAQGRTQRWRGRTDQRPPRRHIEHHHNLASPPAASPHPQKKGWIQRLPIGLCLYRVELNSGPAGFGFF